MLTPALGELDLGSLALSYDIGESDYRFQSRFGLVGNDFGILFAADEGKSSHLLGDGPELEDCEDGSSSLISP
jgi:hypothetical protein